MVTVIFPAAGQSRRMEAGMNKVFLNLMGKPILIHTLIAFSRCDSVDDLIVVVASEEVAKVRSMLRAVPGLKPWQVVAGGTERQYSIANGLGALRASADVVLVHDGARPLTSNALITAVVEAAKRHGAAITAVPAKDTIKIADEDGCVIETPKRNTLWSVQTPQGFKRDILVNAYQQAAQDHFLGTDDSSLVERLGVQVKIVEGEYGNLKITTPEDMLIAEAFLREGAVSKLTMGVSTFVSEVKDKFRRRR